MNCLNCGTYNNEGFKFCIKCGNSLKTESISTEQVVETEEVLTEHSTQAQQPIQTVVAAAPSYNVDLNQHSTTVNNNTFNFIKYIISFIIKPFETYKNNEDKLSNTKNGLILGGIVAGAMMVINLLSSMISAIFVKSIDYSTFQTKTKIDLAGLKNLDYLSLIVKNLLIYACIIVAIAGVYYLASLVVKKSTNFIKILSISASSIIPYVIMGMFVSPLLVRIWSPLSIVSTIIGAVYSIIIFVMLISDNIKFDKKDLTAYFHLVCMSVLGITGYYVYMKLFTSNVTNQISDYLNMFN